MLYCPMALSYEGSTVDAVITALDNYLVQLIDSQEWPIPQYPPRKHNMQLVSMFSYSTDGKSTAYLVEKEEN